MSEEETVYYQTIIPQHDKNICIVWWTNYQSFLAHFRTAEESILKHKNYTDVTLIIHLDESTKDNLGYRRRDENE